MRILWFAAVMLSVCASARAHDFWLQPQKFHPSSGEAVTIAMLVGHGPDRAPWGVSTERVSSLRSVERGATQNSLALLRARQTADQVTMTFNATGAHVLVLESTFAKSALPAERFENYAREEGLTLVLRERERLQQTGAPGRERYSRRAKTLVQVGASARGGDPHVTRPVGHTLEIVPERDPYAPGGALPVRVIFEGAPLPGALVKLTDLAADARPVETQVTNANGRAVFTARTQGAWLLNVVWSKPVTDDPTVDFETTFASLTFGYR